MELGKDTLESVLYGSSADFQFSFYLSWLFIHETLHSCPFSVFSFLSLDLDRCFNCLQWMTFLYPRSTFVGNDPLKASILNETIRSHHFDVQT